MNEIAEKPRLSRQTRELLEPESKFPMKFVLMVGGLFVVVAIILDFSGVGRKKPFQPFDIESDLQNIALNLEGDRYTDVDDLFSITIPPRWRIETQPASMPYDVILYGPNQTDISIIASRVDFNTLPELQEDIDRREREAGIATVKEPFYYKGRPTLKRVTTLRHSKVLAIDFVKDHVAHHILFGAPPEYYERYEPAFMALLDTYEPMNGAKETAP